MPMKIRISPETVLFYAVMAITQKQLFLAATLAALFHECGHLLAARLLSIRLRSIELDLFGARIYPAAQIPSYRAELLLAAAGPAFSLLLGLLLLPHAFPFARLVLTATLSFALFNSAPIAGFDGGRILYCLLARLFGITVAEEILSVTTYLTLLLLFALSSCMLLRFGQNLALTVLTASLFARQFLK